MCRLVVLLAAVVLVLAPVSFSLAADPAPGTLSVAGKSYKLAHVVAYDTKVDDEPLISVLASDRPIAVDKIKASLKENDGSDERLSLSQPHVKVTFDKSGKIGSCSAWANNSFFSDSGDSLTGELKLDGSRVTGKAKLATQGEGERARGFEFEFAVGLLGTAAEEAPKAAALAKLGVTGKFKGNGKEAKLAFVSARAGEEFNDQPSLVLIFSENDHSKDPNPKFNVGFGKYGSSLIISCHEDGGIFGCQVGHAAHEKRGFSSIGQIELGEFQIAGGQVQGKLATGKENEFFGETWEVDLTFAAKYAAQAKPADPKPADPKPTVTTDKPATKRRPEEPKVPAAATPGLKAKDLAIPKGATNVEFKTLVEHIAFQSPGDVKAVVAEFSKSLAAQGWTSDGSDLVTAKSSILSRKRGEAKLTIFVKPADSGSTVTMFTDGLIWEE